MKNVFGFLAALLILSGCATTYTLDGQSYSGADQLQSAADTLYRDTRTQLVSTMRVSAPISKKTLTIGIPTVDAIKDGWVMPNALQVTPTQLVQRDVLARTVRKEYETFAVTVKEIGIYQDVKVVDTTGGHIQPSSTESVLYMYVVPNTNAFQWYLNGGKTGLQTVNIDRGQPKLLGRATSFMNSVKGYALTDEAGTATAVAPAMPSPAPAAPAAKPAPAQTASSPAPVQVPVAATAAIASPPAPVATPATTSAAPTASSRSIFSAERYAKAAGCMSPVATMNIRTTSSETFTVKCSNGEALSVRCDDGNCRELK